MLPTSPCRCDYRADTVLQGLCERERDFACQFQPPSAASEGGMEGEAPEEVNFISVKACFSPAPKACRV